MRPNKQKKIQGDLQGVANIHNSIYLLNLPNTFDKYQSCDSPTFEEK